MHEPGLILTPPPTATAEEDSYLSGSEIAAPMLDADWVMLSACYTAGGAGQGEAAETLSGSRACSSMLARGCSSRTGRSTALKGVERSRLRGG
jgi:hypothetical protein